MENSQCHAYQKWIQSYSELISSNRVWNYTREIHSEMRNVSKSSLISVYLHIFFELTSMEVVFFDKGSETVIFLFTSRDFVFPPCLQERLASQPQCSEVYINSISPFCKAQFTLVRIHFLQNKFKELFWVLTHIRQSTANQYRFQTLIIFQEET